MLELVVMVRESGNVLHTVRLLLPMCHNPGSTGIMLASAVAGGSTEAAPFITATIEAQVGEWITSLKSTVRSASDRERYRREVRRAYAALGWSCAADATFTGLVQYLDGRRAANMKGSTPLRGKSYNAVLSKVRGFFEFAVRAGWCSANPTDGIAWADEQDSEEGSRAFTAGELAAVLATAGTPNPGDKRRSTDRYYAYLLATATPLRRSTIARLQWPMLRTWAARFGDEAYPAGELRLPRKAVKKSKRVQVLPLPRWAVEALLEWRELCGSPKEGPVFPRLSEHRTLLDDCAAVGVPRYTEEGGVGWNSFRKFYLTDMATRTMPAVLNELSGHQDIRTTLKFYVGQTREQAAAAVAGIENPSNVGKFPRGGASGRNRGGRGSVPDVDKCEQPPSPHGANLTKGVGPRQDVPTSNGGRVLPNHCAAENDPMGIRTPRGYPGGLTERRPNYRLLAVEMARGLRQVAGAVVEALENEEFGHGGDHAQDE